MAYNLNSKQLYTFFGKPNDSTQPIAVSTRFVESIGIGIGDYTQTYTWLIEIFQQYTYDANNKKYNVYGKPYSALYVKQ